MSKINIVAPRRDWETLCARINGVLKDIPGAVVEFAEPCRREANDPVRLHAEGVPEHLLDTLRTLLIQERNEQ